MDNTVVSCFRATVHAGRSICRYTFDPRHASHPALLGNLMSELLLRMVLSHYEPCPIRVIDRTGLQLYLGVSGVGSDVIGALE